MKLPTLFSIRTVMWLNAATASLCLGLAIVPGPIVLRLINAGFAGVGIASFSWIALFFRIKKRQDMTVAALAAMVQLNRHLIADRVEFILETQNENPGAPPDAVRH